jgi:hypothetical protein
MKAKVNRAFPAVPGDLREWSRFLGGLFYARPFTTTLLGCTTAPTATARYTVSAGIVCLALPDLSATSNSALAFLDGLPSQITPQHDQQCLARVINNGVTAVGIVQVGIDTGITLFKDIDAGAFTAAGTKGIKYSICTYPLD